MVIFSRSRYVGAKVVTVRMEDGAVRPYVYGRVMRDSIDDRRTAAVVTFQAGMELDMFTFKFLKDERAWWRVADINEILFPLEDQDETGDHSLTIGKVLFVPTA